VDTLLRLYREFVSPEQKKFAAKVEGMGGRDAVRNSEKLMRELAKEEPSMRRPTKEESTPAARSGLGSDNRCDTGRSFNFLELKREIERPPDEAIEKNLEHFNAKFDLQKKQIEKKISQEADRIISTVIAGPHDRIFDPVRRESFSICMN